MSKLTKAIGYFYILLGLSVVVVPDWFLSVDWPSRQGLYIAAGLRVVIGFILILAASASRFPRVFRVFGGLALIAGLLMPFMSLLLWSEYMEWWMVDHYTLFRAIFAVAGTVLGGFLIWASEPKRSHA